MTVAALQSFKRHRQHVACEYALQQCPLLVQGETTEDHSGLEGQDGYAADASFGAAPEEVYDLQPQDQQQQQR